MKKILAILLALSILLTLAACGENKETTTTGESTGATDTIENNPTDGPQGSTQGTIESTTDRDATAETNQPVTTNPPTTETTNDSPDSTQGTTVSTIGRGDTTTTSNPRPTSTNSTNEQTGGISNADINYLVFEKQNGGYCVTGVTDAAPKSIVIPDKYAGLPVTHIGSWAFAYNEKITSITISNNVSSIGECAFEQCYNLKTVSIGSGVSSIGNGAFRYCTSLTSINIPSNVKSINYSAFEGCSKLSSITLNFGVQKIGDSAFCGTALTNVTIPNSVSSIGYGVFQSCKHLKTVTLGAGITCISSALFNECTALTSITIPINIIKIDSFAFSECSAISRITIPHNVKSIGSSAFSGCEKLNNIIYTGTQKNWSSLTLGELWNDYVPATQVICSDGTISLNGDTGSSNPSPSKPTPSESKPTPPKPTPSVPQPVRVSGIQLSKTTLTLNVGDTHQLTATISPSNADNKDVTWLSSDNSVVQVSSSGKITAKGKGPAIITVTTDDGKFTATCTVTVTEPPLTVKASIGVGYYMSSSGSVRGVFAEAIASGGSENYVEYYIKVYYNGNLVAEGAKGEIIVTLANGTYTAEVYVKDSSGNEATSTESVRLSGY